MLSEDAFGLGLLVGIVMVLVIQLLLRLRKRRKNMLRTDGRMVQENARLTREVEDLHARLAVLEEIATDPAARTAREIDSLR